MRALLLLLRLTVMLLLLLTMSLSDAKQQASRSSKSCTEQMCKSAIETMRVGHGCIRSKMCSRKIIKQAKLLLKGKASQQKRIREKQWKDKEHKRKLKTRMLKLRQDKKDLSSEFVKMKTQQKRLLEEIYQLKGELKTVKQKNTELKKNEEKLESEIDASAMSWDEERRTIERIQEEKNEMMMREISKIQGEKEEMRRDKEKLEGEKEEMRREKEKLEGEKEEMRREKEKLEGEMEETANANTALSQHNRKVQEEHKSCTVQLNQAKADLEVGRLQADKSRSEMRKYQGEVAKYINEVNSYKKQHLACQKEAQGYSRVAPVCQEKIENLKECLSQKSYLEKRCGEEKQGSPLKTTISPEQHKAFFNKLRYKDILILKMREDLESCLVSLRDKNSQDPESESPDTFSDSTTSSLVQNLRETNMNLQQKLDIAEINYKACKSSGNMYPAKDNSKTGLHSEENSEPEVDTVHSESDKQPFAETVANTVGKVRDILQSYSPEELPLPRRNKNGRNKMLKMKRRTL